MLKSTNNADRCLFLLVMLYMTIKLMTLVLIYKIVKIGPITASASAFIMPIWFFLGDIIVEVFGFKRMRSIIACALLCQFVFAFGCYAFAVMPTIAPYKHQLEYMVVLAKIPKVVIASFLAILVGVYTNSYILSKWKALVRGKYFWMRSLGSTMIGEFIFTLIAYSMEFYNVVPMVNLVHLMLVSYGIKMLVNLFSVIPATIIVKILKSVVTIEDDDYVTINESNMLSVGALK